MRTVAIAIRRARRPQFFSARMVMRFATIARWKRGRFALLIDEAGASAVLQCRLATLKGGDPVRDIQGNTDLQGSNSGSPAL